MFVFWCSREPCSYFWFYLPYTWVIPGHCLFRDAVVDAIQSKAHKTEVSYEDPNCESIPREHLLDGPCYHGCHHRIMHTKNPLRSGHCARKPLNSCNLLGCRGCHSGECACRTSGQTIAHARKSHRGCRGFYSFSTNALSGKSVASALDVCCAVMPALLLPSCRAPVPCYDGLLTLSSALYP